MLSGCTSEERIDSMDVDVYLIVTSHNASVVPEHQIVTINKSSTMNVTFMVSTSGAFNHSLLAKSINVDGIAFIDCPRFFDTSIRNETDQVIDYQKTVVIVVNISTNASLPKEMQSVFINYG
jgi:hypothetical protein